METGLPVGLGAPPTFQDSWTTLAGATVPPIAAGQDVLRLYAFWTGASAWTFRSIVNSMSPKEHDDLLALSVPHSGKMWKLPTPGKKPVPLTPAMITVVPAPHLLLPDQTRAAAGTPDPEDPDGLPPILRAVMDKTAFWTDPEVWHLAAGRMRAPQRLARNVAMFLMQRRPVAAFSRWPGHPVWSFGLSSNNRSLLEHSGMGLYPAAWMGRLLNALPHQAPLLGLMFTPSSGTACPLPPLRSKLVLSPADSSHAAWLSSLTESARQQDDLLPKCEPEVTALSLPALLPSAVRAMGTWSLADPGRLVDHLLARPAAPGLLRLLLTLPGLSENLLQPQNVLRLLGPLARSRQLHVLAWLVTHAPKGLQVPDSIQLEVESALVLVKSKSLRHVNWGTLGTRTSISPDTPDAAPNSAAQDRLGHQERVGQLLLDLWVRWGVPSPSVLRHLITEARVSNPGDPVLLNAIMTYHHPGSPGWDSALDDPVLVDATLRYNLDNWLVDHAHSGWVPDDQAWATEAAQARPELRVVVEQAVLERFTQAVPDATPSLRPRRM